ncbi:hypothetical protein RRG08_038065 [Elysia crispata]|uniref:Uncharacterized protein n=1 Tax=Elysia crispata TaxID=231223 RepID=A0AAE0ZZG3_9GAST|nr:hypothetical protein RRG08_038065 [Elysia crispata]
MSTVLPYIVENGGRKSLPLSSRHEDPSKFCVLYAPSSHHWRLGETSKASIITSPGERFVERIEDMAADPRPKGAELYVVGLKTRKPAPHVYDYSGKTAGKKTTKPNISHYSANSRPMRRVYTMILQRT